MKNKIKFWLVLPALFAASFYFSDKALAQSEEPILIEINDTQIGTTAFEQLIQYGNGGHAAMGTLLGEGQGMQTNPGIGFSIGSGGNGYRPSIIIAVWTDQPFDTAAAIATIKSHLNVPTNPVTTNGDCAIACDGTVQPEPVVQNVQPETAVQTNENLDQQPVSTQQPAPQEQQQEPVVLQNNTQPYTPPIENLESFASLVTPTDVIVQSPISNKLINNKKVIKKKKITTKKVVRHATNKTTR